MTKFISIFASIVIGTFVFSMVSCKPSKPANKIESQDLTGPEYLSAFICPMHCKGSGSDHPGECPVCHMPLEKNENFKTDSIK
ncbi:MAG: hypothetical protein IPJ64_05005 [Saprospiraceae bacterium]|jgi:hypothetical protein|nr:hypothetical protein [Saprospiraceae bacterium]MBK7795714.1 hypothetical protein [Saprospiraceae bacterium]